MPCRPLLVATFVSLVACWVVPLRADPSLKRIFPAGGQRGATVEVAALGEAPTWPVQVWCDDPGIRWEPLADKGKFRVSVASDVALGAHAFRFYDADNATAAMRFQVGQIAEINEVEPNEALDKAQVVSELPKLINGVLEKRSEVDTFAVDLAEGQTLIAAVDAQRHLRSPLDATLQIVSSRGSVLAQNLDTVGLDPRIDFVAPRAGRYFVRIFGFPETPDSSINFAGGENFVYRLTLAHAGYIYAARPLAVSSTQSTQVELFCLHMPVMSASVNVPADAQKSSWSVTTDKAVNALSLPVVALPLVKEQSHGGEAAVQVVAVPCSITGTLDKPRQVDRYRFTAKKDSKLRFELHSRDLGFATDGVIAIVDADGKQLSREDDVRKDVDAKAIWQPPADGEYTLEVSDAFGFGSAECFYRVDIQPVTADVALSFKVDYYPGKVKENKPIEIAVTIDRQDGFAHPLRISAEGLPDSVKCPVVVSEKEGATAKEVTLKLTASAPFSGPIRIVGRVESDSSFQRIATASGDPLVKDIFLTIKP